jgi:hypothetical protein
MAIVNGLITAAEYAQFSGYPYPTDPTKILETDLSITMASRDIEQWTGREFHTTASSVRFFDSMDARTVNIDDCSAVSLVRADFGMDGTYAMTVTAYQLLPVGGRTPVLGSVAYTKLRGTLLAGATFPINTIRLGSVEVTATWGWAAVPDLIKHATAIYAQDLLRDSQAGFGGLQVSDLGIINSRIPQRVKDIIAPYRRIDRVTGLA